MGSELFCHASSKVKLQKHNTQMIKKKTFVIGVTINISYIFLLLVQCTILING